MGPRRIVVLAAVLILAACGGGEKTQRSTSVSGLVPTGHPVRSLPFSRPSSAPFAAGIATPYQVAQLVRQGPAPGEWGQGFVETIDPQTRIRSVSVTGSAATVELAGGDPDFYGSAALVYSLTSLPEIDTVRFRLDGRACCVYAHSGQPIESLTAKSFDYWQGEPCAMRVQADAVMCRDES